MASDLLRRQYDEMVAENASLTFRIAALEAEVKRLTERATASDETVNAIMQDLVDMPPDDPEHDDTLCTSYDHLVLVLNRHTLGIE